MIFESALAPASALSPDAVEACLIARGWRLDGEAGPSGRFLSKESDGAVSSVLLATKPTSPRYASAMGLLVEQVAATERISQETLLRDLTMAAFDVVRVRLVEATDGSFDLDRILKVVRESRAALVAAANAAASRTPRKNYAGRQHEVVGGYAERIRLAQTERGSFVLPLLCPYAYEIGDDPAFGSLLPLPWFGRRVTQKLTTALEAIDEALGFGGGADGIEAFTRATPQGVSANMCAALGRLIEAGGRVEVAVRWALVQPEDQAPKPFEFDSSSAPLLLRAAGKLAEADPPPAEPVAGFVTKLQQPDRAIVEAWIEGKFRNVHIDIPDVFRPVFSLAWNDRRPVVVSGKAVVDGKRIVMASIDDVTMSDSEE